MTFRRFDAGENHRPKDAPKGDCQVRALTTARGMPYLEAWSMLYALQGERKMCELPLVEALRDSETRLGFLRELSFPAKRGQPRMTGKTFCERYKRGRFILRMAGHVVAVKDGVLYDRGDTSDCCVYLAWEVTPFECAALESEAAE